MQLFWNLKSSYVSILEQTQKLNNVLKDLTTRYIIHLIPAFPASLSLLKRWSMVLILFVVVVFCFLQVEVLTYITFFLFPKLMLFLFYISIFADTKYRCICFFCLRIFSNNMYNLKIYTGMQMTAISLPQRKKRKRCFCDNLCF